MKSRLALMSLVVMMAAGLTVKAQEKPATLKVVRAEMDAFQKGQVDSLRNMLQKDSEFSAEYKVFLTELDKLQGIKDAQLRFQMAEKINKKHVGLFDRAMKKSKADPQAIQKNAKKMEKKYSIKNIKYHIEPGEYMTYKVWLEHVDHEQPPQETEISFSAPFEFEHSSRTGDGTITADLEEGKMFASAHAFFAGSVKNKAGLGDYVRVPWATQDIRVSAKLPETDIYMQAYAGPGGAGAAASSVIDVLTEDGEQCKKTQEHGSVIAPVVWYSKLELLDTTIMACEMEAPPANQDIVVRFQGVAEATAGGAATGMAYIDAKPAPIRVRLIE